MFRSIIYFLCFLCCSSLTNIYSSDLGDQKIQGDTLLGQVQETVAIEDPDYPPSKKPFWTKRRLIPMATGMLICLTTAIGAYEFYNKLVDQHTGELRQEAIHTFMNQSNITGSIYWGSTIPYDMDDKGGGPLPFHFRECLVLPTFAECSYQHHCGALDLNDTSNCIFNCNATKPYQQEDVIIHGSLLDTISIVNRYCGCQIKYWYDLALQAYQQKLPENRTLICTPNQDNLSLCCGRVSYSMYNSSYVQNSHDRVFLRFVYGNATEAGESAVETFMNHTKINAHQNASIFTAVGQTVGVLIFLLAFIDYFCF